MWSRWCVRERTLVRGAARAARQSLLCLRFRTVVPVYLQKPSKNQGRKAYLDNRGLPSHTGYEEIPLNDDLVAY